MPKLISLLKKQVNALQSQAQSIPAPSSDESTRASRLQRRIHPDLDSLVVHLDEHQSSNLSRNSITVENADSIDFAPLGPRIRHWPHSESPWNRQRQEFSPAKGTASQDVPHTPSAKTDQKAPNQRRTAVADIQDRHILSSSPGGAWSTFGRGGKATPSVNLEDAVNLASSSGIGQLSGSHKQICTPTSITRSTRQSSSSSSHTQLHDEKSFSGSNATASTPRSQQGKISPVSYHTFGSRKLSSPYTFKEPPPPLPPLNHPAFRSVEYKKPRISPPLRIAHESDTLQRNHPRRSVSLPSLSSIPPRHRTVSESSRSTRRITKKRRKVDLHYLRKYDSSEAVIPGPIRGAGSKSGEPSGHWVSHNTCSHSGRRYNAEGTPESVDIKDITRKSQARRDVIEMASKVKAMDPVSIPTNVSDLSIFGTTRGRRAQSNKEALRLGSPFLLQDTHHHIVPKTGWHEDRGKPPYNHDITRPEKGEGKTYEMTQPDISTNNTAGQRKVKEICSHASTGNKNQRKPANQSRSFSLPKPERILQSGSGIFLSPPSLSLTSPTPEASPVSPLLPIQLSGQAPSSFSQLSTPPPALKSSLSRTTGKRKAEEAEVEAGTPPKDNRKEYRATFAPERRPHRLSENSGSSHAPSSYRRKRARLSLTSESHSISRTPTTTSLGEHLGVGITGSWSSRGSTRGQTPASPQHYPSRQSMNSYHPSNHSQRPHRAQSRRSLSQASIPISALISPHAPSVSPSVTFHMHDPRRPGPIQRTPWMLTFPSQNVNKRTRWTLDGWIERGGSPIHAWLFFIGFTLFPVWWVAAMCIAIPRTRRIGEGETEKGVVLDDPQVEYDSKSWRTRCRIMLVVSLFTYIPFIILVAIFARR
ncbi:hypothetical protein AX17_006228 [Amanita inopinata Kibby_2008]|nr:hypothetical protein AX17_006228 [Amanita inopinata Kibby_2008]